MYKNIQTKAVSAQYPITICVCGLLPCDSSNCSINRVYIDEINNYLYCMQIIIINFINHTPLTGLFKMDLFKPNLIYTVNYIFSKKETPS